MAQRWRWRDVVLFVAFLAVFTSIGASLAIVSGNLFGARGYYVRILMWSPALAAFATAIIEKRAIREFGWKWGDAKWQLQTWLLPLVYVSISYGILWLLGWGKVPNPEFVANASKAVSLSLYLLPSPPRYLLSLPPL